MKKLLISVSALALTSAAAVAAEPIVYAPPAVPAPAAPALGTTAYVDAAYGIVTGEGLALGGGAEPDISTIQLGGAANIPFGTWNFELEVDGSSLDIEDGLATISTLSGAAHVYSRAGSLAWGPYASWERISLGGAGTDIRSLGLEAAWLSGSFVVIGQGQFSWLDNGAGGDEATAWRARLLGRYYATPNLKLEAGIAYTSLDDNGGGLGTGDFFLAEGEIEYMFGNGIAVFGAVDHVFGDALSDESLTTIVGGVRLHANTPSLQDQSTSGALFDTSNFLL